MDRWAEKRQEQLDTIDAQLAGAEHTLAMIEQAADALEAAGMYDALPTESWESKNGGPAKYLYMYFGLCGQGGRRHWGPDGKRKVYVGCKADKVAEALRLATNRRKWEELDEARQNLTRWIREQDLALRQRARYAEMWTVHQPAELWEPGDVAEYRQVAEAYLERLATAHRGGYSLSHTLL